MKLSELLKQLVDSEKISSEESKSISTAVDAIKGKSVKDLNAKNEELVKELSDFRAAKRTKHVNSLVGELTDEDKIKDAIALAGLSNEDSDEDVLAKVTKTIESRKYLQKTVIGTGDPTPGSVTDNTQKQKETVTESPARVISGVAV